MKIFYLGLIIGLLWGCKNNDANFADSDGNEIILQKMKNYIAMNQNDTSKVNSPLLNSHQFDSYTAYSLDTYYGIIEQKQNNELKSAKINNFEFKTFLTKQPKPACFEHPMSELEKTMFRSIVRSLDNRTNSESIAILYALDEFVFDNLCDKNQQERMLYIIGALKIGFLQRREESILPTNSLQLKSGKLNYPIIALSGAAWDRCFDRCMNDKYDDLDVVEWIEFLINPPAHVAWSAGSCVWRCSWE